MAEFTYANAGVDIDNADVTKREMARSLQTNDARAVSYTHLTLPTKA